MPKAPSFRVDVFGAHLHVPTTRKQLAHLRRKFNLSKAESVAATWVSVDTEANNTPHLTVWVDTERVIDRVELVEVIAHEATHAAAGLLDHIGQETKQHDGEVLAYLVGWIAARIWEAIP